MATPKVSTDDSTDLDEAVLNLYVTAVKLQVKLNYCTILFTASTNTPTVVAGVDSDGEIVTGDLSWDAGDEEIDITISGFTAIPVGVTTIQDNNSSNVHDLQYRHTNTTTVHIRPTASGGETSVDPDGDIQFSLILIGL